MIRLAIVEDEKIYSDQLREYLETYQQESGNPIYVSVFEDGEDLIDHYQGNFDIILMDIQMRFMDGMTAAEKIRERDREVIIMFITNMANYAIRGYAVDALDYLLKPVTYFSFSQKLDRAIDRMKRRETKTITVPIPSGVQKLEISDIYFVESQGHHLVFRTKRGDYRCRGKMKETEERLCGEGFFRSNKGYLVNLSHVESIRENCCVVGGEYVLISRARKNEFMEALASYMGDAMK